nr:MAG TPA: hypothetical protein [Caudoviricetes sp.]
MDITIVIADKTKLCQMSLKNEIWQSLLVWNVWNSVFMRTNFQGL